jgi:hypothetical protein
MFEFDVSCYVIPSRRDPDFGLVDITDWLHKYVGVQDPDVTGLTRPVVRKGVGWEIRSRKNGKETSDGEGYAVITWHALIEDEKKAMLFALKWIK